MFTVVGQLNAETINEQDKLAYLKYTGEYWQVFVLDKEGNEKKVSATAYDKSTLTWLADGVHLFTCGIQGDAEIINIENAQSKIIELPRKSINDAVLSPDGEQVVYSHIASGSTDNKLWLYNTTLKSDKPIFPRMQGRQYDAKWNVTGDHIYFITGIADTSYGINKAALTDTKSTVVVGNARYNLDVDVSTNGKIAYSSNLKNSFDIWIKDGDDIRQLTKEHGSEARPSWSQDERRIYFERMHDGVTNVWSVNVSDGQMKQVTFSKSGARFPVAYKRSKQ